MRSSQSRTSSVRSERASLRSAGRERWWMAHNQSLSSNQTRHCHIHIYICTIAMVSRYAHLQAHIYVHIYICVLRRRDDPRKKRSKSNSLLRLQDSSLRLFAYMYILSSVCFRSQDKDLLEDGKSRGTQSAITASPPNRNRIQLN